MNLLPPRNFPLGKINFSWVHAISGLTMRDGNNNLDAVKTVIAHAIGKSKLSNAMRM
jgi:hypothetical protein